MTTCIDLSPRCLRTTASLFGEARQIVQGPFDIDTARALSAVCGYRVRSLAAYLRVSPRQLQRLFLRQLGCPPERWLREERLRVAGQLLLTTQGVKQVAFALAFRSESQFCRDFRAHFGCTPAEWAGRGGAAAPA